MRIKNQTVMQAARVLLPMLWRDLQVIGYVLSESAVAAGVRQRYKAAAALAEKTAPYHGRQGGKQQLYGAMVCGGTGVCSPRGTRVQVNHTNA